MTPAPPCPAENDAEVKPVEDQSVTQDGGTTPSVKRERDWIAKLEDKLPQPPRYLRRNGWRVWHMVALPLMVAAAILSMLDVWSEIFRVAIWDPEQSHIFLVPVVAVWLAWVRRRRIHQCRPVGTWAGPLVVVLSWGLMMVGYANNIETFWYGGAVGVLGGCVVAVTGVEVFLKFSPAFAVLAFLVPIPALIRHPLAINLQYAAARSTQSLLDLMGVVAGRSGNLLTVNDTAVTIAEACNGMRMVFALVLVSYAFAFSMPLRPSARVMILLLSPVSALLCNVVRLIPMVWLYGVAPPAVADFFHTASDWVMVLMAYLLLLAVLRVLVWAMIPIRHFNLATN